MTQTDLFGPTDGTPQPKPVGSEVVRLQVFVTVKAAPNPSEKYGETVCVAGLSTDLNRELNRNVRSTSDAKSLGLIRPREVSGLKIKPHPGWTADQKKKIDAYVNQLELFGEQDRTPLEAPRFQASYQYRCHDRACKGHDQGLIDWEFVALQRRLRDLSNDEVRRELEIKFLTMMCDPARDVGFFVGNQAKRPHVFSVLGVYYPKR